MKKETVTEMNTRLQKENEQESFKQSARMLAIEKAMGVNQGFGVDRLIVDAEKIYQWLINL